VNIVEAAESTSAKPAAAAAAGSKKTKVPDFAGHMLESDMQGLGPDGKLTPEEQAILDGKEGPEMAKLMKIQVVFGNTFGADKLVDLGGAPHSNLYPGDPGLHVLRQCGAEPNHRGGGRARQ
jgi:hypothetical protein